jgi:hypothetical protein
LLWADKAEANLDLHYQLTFAEAGGPLAVELTITNLAQDSLDLFVTSFRENNYGNYFSLVSGITAAGADGTPLSFNVVQNTSPSAAADVGHQDVTVDRVVIDVTGQDTVTISYQLPSMSEIYPHLMESEGYWNTPPPNTYYATYEYVLLRPSRASAAINGAWISHSLPDNWILATTYPQENGVYNTDRLSCMYSDNSPPYWNHNETMFICGHSQEVSVDRRSYQGIEYVLVGTSETSMSETSKQAYGAMTAYYSEVLGGLPINRRMQVELIPFNYWPSPHLQSHPLFGEWMSMGELNYKAWQWGPDPGPGGINHSVYYTGVHRLGRAWIGDMLQWLKSPNSLPYIILIDEGLINYFENTAMGRYWGDEGPAESRFAGMYEYYLNNWLGTAYDQPLGRPMNQVAVWRHTFEDFKATLVVYFLNKKILENSGGAKSIADVSRLFYQRYGLRQSGDTYTLNDFVQTVNDATGSDYSDFFNRYVFGTEALPLDQYFSSPAD